MTPDPAADPLGVPSPDTEVDPTAPDESGGYTLCLSVLADGSFTVSEGPLTEYPDQGGDNNLHTFTDFTQAVKAVVKLYREHPIGASEQEGFDAGYGRGAMPSA